MPHLSELDEAECLKLLRAGWFGRFGVQTEQGPLVVPVNYLVRDDTIVARTSPLGILARCGADAPLAFEIDLVDEERWHGWSVVARGRGRLERRPATTGAQTARPWADGDRSCELHLTWSELTGRRIGDGWDLLSSMTTRRVSP